MFSSLRSASLSASGHAGGAAVLLPGGAGHAAGHSAAGAHPGGTRPPEGLRCACAPLCSAECTMSEIHAAHPSGKPVRRKLTIPPRQCAASRGLDHKAHALTHMVRQVGVDDEYEVARGKLQPVHIGSAQPELARPRLQQLQGSADQCQCRSSCDHVNLLPRSPKAPQPARPACASCED